MFIKFFRTLFYISFLSALAPLISADEKKGGYVSSVPKPSLTKVSYGKHKRNIMDFWKAPSERPTPVVLVFHGGGWVGGSKERIDRFVDTQKLLDSGISVAAINYRLIKHSQDLDPYVKGPMEDATRAIQFLRSKSSEWNIDKTNVALSGGSAGACTSLWLAYHDEMADPQSSDPIARESTRVTCVAALRAQTTLDPKQMQEWISNIKYGGHAFGQKDFVAYLNQRDELISTINQYSPYALLSEDDPPTYLFYTKPPSKTKKEKDPTHSALFGVHLKAHCDELNVPCELVYPQAENVTHKTATDYLINKLAIKK